VAQAPPGLELKSVEVLPEGAPKARARSFSYQIPVPAGRGDGLPEKIERLMASSSWPIRRPQRHTSVDLRPLLEELSLQAGVLRMRLGAGSGAAAGPRDVLSALGLSDLELEGVHLTRTAVEVRS
jgi:hypothetical protein